MGDQFNIENFIQSRADLANISSKSHIVTVFGDVISQHGGIVWLGSLIACLQPLGFSERLIRTSVFRLVKDDWLQVKKQGRKSFYAFTDSANKHYTKAARRIYAGETPYSDGQWLIVIPAFVAEDKINSFRRQLRWLGFSPLSSGAYAHPSIDQSSLEETINELELGDSVVVFRSRTLDSASNQVLSRLVKEKWNLDELDFDYKQFIESYQPIEDWLNQKELLSDHQSFLVRTLLIHEYRRILLKDHELPQDMLPPHWNGFVATRLVKRIYEKLARSSNRYIVSHLYNLDGLLGEPDSNFFNRFK